MPTLVTFRPNTYCYGRNVSDAIGIMSSDGRTVRVYGENHEPMSVEMSWVGGRERFAQTIHIPDSALNPASDATVKTLREELAAERAHVARLDSLVAETKVALRDANARTYDANGRATRLSAELSALRAEVSKPGTHDQSPALAALVTAQRQAIDALTVERNQALTNLATLRATVRSVVDGAEK